MSDRAVGQADILVRLLPIKGAGAAANWASHQLAEMKRTVTTSEAFQQAWPGSRYGLGIVWVPNSCGGSWSHGGDIMGYMTRNGVTPDGSRSVMVSFNTDSPKREPGVPSPKHEMTRTLIDHALCGVGGGS